MANDKSTESPRQPADEKQNAPANPAGERLQDGDLDSVAGGAFEKSSSMTTEGAYTLGCCTL